MTKSGLIREKNTNHKMVSVPMPEINKNIARDKNRMSKENKKREFIVDLKNKLVLRNRMIKLLAVLVIVLIFAVLMLLIIIGNIKMKQAEYALNIVEENRCY